MPTGSEDAEILYLIVSDSEKKIGMTLGKRLIRDQKEIEDIVIYKKDPDGKYTID